MDAKTQRLVRAAAAVFEHVTTADVLFEPANCGTTAAEIRYEQRRLARAEAALWLLARAEEAFKEPHV